MQAHYLQGESWAAAREAVDWRSRVVTTSEGGVRIYTRKIPLVGTIGYAPLCLPILGKNALLNIKAITDTCDDLFAVRIEPEQDVNTIDTQAIKQQGIIRPKKSKIQYQSTIEIKLDQSEDDLLASFSKGMRYNIRKADKRGVKIVPVPANEANLATLYDFKTVTSERADHYLRPRAFLMDFWGRLAANDQAVLLRVEHESELVAIGLSAIEGNRAWNIATGSLRTKRSLAAPALMHWEMMKQLKQRNISRYDLTGISPPAVRADKSNPMNGVDSFKVGFGEQYIHDYPGTFDLVLNKSHYNRWAQIEQYYVRVKTKLSGKYWW